MGRRNPWFEIFSFLAGLLMLGGVVVSVVKLRRGEPQALAAEEQLLLNVSAIGIYVLLAILFFWMSLRLGWLQKNRREAK